MNQRILMIEDEPGLRLTLGDRLISEGYRVDTASDGLEGEEKARGGDYDIILLDVMLPGKGGFDVCRDLRQQGITTPILMLTARGQTIDKVVGLKIGADDYLTKPFETMELLARIEVLMRRQSSPVVPGGATYSFGHVNVDIRRTEVRKGSEVVSLAAKEFQLLKYFLEHRGDTLSRDVLLHEVWGYDSTPTTRTVDVHVAWLRQKLEDDSKQPKWILTVHGMGYKFTE
jgi:two-component system alkaline phosphatase synthesis response regulator PhoP